MRPDAEWTYDGVSITPYETGALKLAMCCDSIAGLAAGPNWPLLVVLVTQPTTLCLAGWVHPASPTKPSAALLHPPSLPLPHCLPAHPHALPAVFVPVNLGMLQSEWSFVRQAAKYTAWSESQV